LLLAAGQLFGVTLEQIPEAQAFHQLCLPGRIEAPGQACLECQVVFHPQAADQVELLEHQADLGTPPVGQLRFAHLVQALIADLDAATVDLIEPGHQVEQGTFSAPGLAHQRKTATLSEVQVERDFRSLHACTSRAPWD